MTDKFESDEDVGPVLRQLREDLKRLQVSAPPHLEMKVLRRLDEDRQKSHRFWKRATALFAGLSTSLVALLVFFVFYSNPEPQLVAVRVSLDGPEAVKIAFVDIDLPPDVNFYSKSFPQMEKVSHLQLAWHPAGKEGLPLVLKSRTKGKKPINLRFLDEDGKVLAEEAMQITFGGTKG